MSDIDYKSKVFTGRRAIYTSTKKITKHNVIKELKKAWSIHSVNRSEIQYLYNYYRGYQPIVTREKEYRKDINNKVVVNRANEIVSFKVGYTFGKPLQYINRSSDEANSEKINKLNDYMFLQRKKSKDKNLAEWFFICGTGYRITLPEKNGKTPFKTFTLDPRDTFVVYHSGLGTPAIMGVKYVTLDNNKILYSAYTDEYYFEIIEDRITKCKPHLLGMIPIIEYPANMARLGAFEIVLPQLDSINTITSNRIDGIEQFIQSLMVFEGVDLEDGEFKILKEEGGIKIPKGSKIQYLVQELNQTQTQTLADDIYQTVLDICGMPNRNGGSSTSDTGAAVIMRDGWTLAEARAQDAEDEFKESECQFLSLVLKIINETTDLDLDESAVDVRFTRRNYENIAEKAQVLIAMLNNDKIHPQLAFSHSGMFVDSETAYTMSMKYYEEKKKEAGEKLLNFVDKKVNDAKKQVNDNV